LSGEARWLAVQVVGQTEQPRILLVAVPYALKAADAQTVGGLPPSAFVLAVPPSATSTSPIDSTARSAAVLPPVTSNVTTTGGAVNAIPLFTTATNIQNSVIAQSGSGATARIGIGTTTPAATLDVKGAATVRGALALPATAAASKTAGTNSQPENLIASVFNSATNGPVNQTFQWKAEPLGNNTATPSATLNLLFSSGSATPSETGLKISPNGRITFASGQTFPGSGTVTSVGLSAPTSDFTISGSPVTTAGTLGLGWKVVPTSASVANAIVKRDASGSFSASVIQAGALSASNPTGTAVSGGSGTGLAVYGISSGSQGIWGESNGSTYSNGSGPDGVHGVTHSSIGSGVGGLNTAAGGVGIWGEAPAGVGFYTPNNVQQARSAGGWVKAMVFVNALNAPYSILRCFNSNLVGSAATTPPCGINFTELSFGDWAFDFGFEVDDRFYSTTFTENPLNGFINVRPISTNELVVETFDETAVAVQAQFSLIVF